MVDLPHTYRDTVGQGHRSLAQSCRYDGEGEEEQIMQGINFIGYYYIKLKPTLRFNFIKIKKFI